jgi:hypothetical protein
VSEPGSGVDERWQDKDRDKDKDKDEDEDTVKDTVSTPRSKYPFEPIRRSTRQPEASRIILEEKKIVQERADQKTVQSARRHRRICADQLIAQFSEQHG